MRPTIADEMWCSGPCECISCGHEWGGAWPLDCADLECPECGSEDTVRDGFQGAEI